MTNEEYLSQQSAGAHNASAESPTVLAKEEIAAVAGGAVIGSFD